ncbi:MAG TPA: hypothetical protein VK721_13695, partial [Solirubrobacteraceae bacterium]|nr:hypothetical protein [Solirubrobacteraceae bacterium]
MALLVGVVAMAATLIPSADAAASSVPAAVAHDAGAMAATIRAQARPSASTHVENQAEAGGGHLLVVS